MKGNKEFIAKMIYGNVQLLGYSSFFSSTSVVVAKNLWFAMDKNGTWKLFNTKPSVRKTKKGTCASWVTSSGHVGCTYKHEPCDEKRWTSKPLVFRHSILQYQQDPAAEILMSLPMVDIPWKETRISVANIVNLIKEEALDE